MGTKFMFNSEQEFKLVYKFSVNEFKDQVLQKVKETFGEEFSNKVTLQVELNQEEGVIVNVTTDSIESLTSSSSLGSEPAKATKEVEEVTPKKSAKKKEVKKDSEELPYNEERANFARGTLKEYEPEPRKFDITNNPDVKGSSDIGSILNIPKAKQINQEEYIYLKSLPLFELTDLEKETINHYELDGNKVYEALYKDKDPVLPVVNQDPKVTDVSWGLNKEERAYLDYWTVMKQLDGYEVVKPAVCTETVDGINVKPERLRKVMKGDICETWVKQPKVAEITLISSINTGEDKPSIPNSITSEVKKVDINDLFSPNDQPCPF